MIQKLYCWKQSKETIQKKENIKLYAKLVYTQKN